MSGDKYRCKICGKPAPPEVIEVIEQREKAGDELEWLLCPECTIKFGDIVKENPNVSPDELRKYYQ